MAPQTFTSHRPEIVRSHRRSSSVLSAQAPTHQKSLKRKRNISTVESSTSSRKIVHRRGGSIIDKLSWMKGVPYDKMEDSIVTEDRSQNEPTSELTASPSSTSLDKRDSPQSSPAEGRRRLSKLNSFSSQLRLFFSTQRRRKESTMSEDSAIDLPDHELPRSPGTQSIISQRGPYFSLTSSPSGSQTPSGSNYDAAISDLQSCAFQGSLRFANPSKESLPSGPSDYWRSNRYEGRRCRYPEGSPYFEQVFRAQSPVKDKPYNADDAHDLEHEDCPSPNSYGARKSSSSLQLFQLPFFSKKKRNTKGKDVVGHNTSATMLFANNPTPFGPESSLSITVDDLGVLPRSDAASIEESSSIPYPTYIGTTHLVTDPNPSPHTKPESRRFSWFSLRRTSQSQPIAAAIPHRGSTATSSSGFSMSLSLSPASTSLTTPMRSSSSTNDTSSVPSTPPPTLQSAATSIHTMSMKTVSEVDADYLELSLHRTTGLYYGGEEVSLL